MRDYEQLLPRYRQAFEAAAKRADLDWRLIAAVGYQESHWDPEAISPKGAQGIMMLTPETASLMGIDNPMDAGQSIVGGSKYLWRMKQRIAKLSPDIPDQDLTWMALAAYNMGYGHLLDARDITKERGGNPDRWVDVKDSAAAADGAPLVFAGPLGLRQRPVKPASTCATSATTTTSWCGWKTARKTIGNPAQPGTAAGDGGRRE